MLASMSDKKKPGRKPSPSSKRSTGEDRHAQPRKAFHAEPELFAAMEEHCRETDLAEAAVLRRALRAYLESVGKWPPGKKE